MTEPNFAKRRKYPRKPLSILVQYRFDTLQDFLSEYCTDVSLGGIFVRTEEPRPHGSMVYLQFTTRDGSKIIEGLGKVMRVVSVAEGKAQNRDPGMGIEFVNLDEESREIIRSIVEDVEKA